MKLNFILLIFAVVVHWHPSLLDASWTNHRQSNLTDEGSDTDEDMDSNLSNMDEGNSYTSVGTFSVSKSTSGLNEEELALKDKIHHLQELKESLKKKEIPGIVQTKETTNINLPKLEIHKKQLVKTLSSLKSEQSKLKILKEEVDNLRKKIQTKSRASSRNQENLKEAVKQLSVQKEIVEKLLSLESPINKRLKSINEQLEKHAPSLEITLSESKTEKIPSKPVQWSYSLNTTANTRIRQKVSEFQQWYTNQYYPFELEPQFAKGKVQNGSSPLMFPLPKQKSYSQIIPIIQSNMAAVLFCSGQKNANQKILLETIGASRSQRGTISKKRGVISCSDLLPTICNKLTCQVKQCGQIEDLAVLCSFCRMKPSSQEDLSTRICQKDYIEAIRNDPSPDHGIHPNPFQGSTEPPNPFTNQY